MAITVKTPLPAKAAPAGQYDKHLTGKPAVATVDVTKKDKNKVVVAESHEQIPVGEGKPIVAPDLYQLHYGASHTINLGNFESAKIEVGLTCPCTKAEIPEMYVMASDWVAGRILEQTALIKGEE